VKIAINLFILALLISFFSTVSADDKLPMPIKNPTALPVFKPKNLGAPKVRIGGGSRGQQTHVELFLLAPEQIGFTTHKQPTLYWYVSKAIKQPIEITITDKFSVAFKTIVNGIDEAGIQALNLADYAIALQQDKKYKWSVAIVNNPQQRSADTFASAGIMVVPEPESLRNILQTAEDVERVVAYANEGVWYDAVASLESLQKNNLDNQMIGAIRDNLLKQVDISLGK